MVWHSAPSDQSGYVIAHEVAAANLALGPPVVIDAVNPVPEARAGWQSLAKIATLVFLETTVPDQREHHRRVSARTPDLSDQVVPTWEEVTAAEYIPWDYQRDGPRTSIDMTDPDQAVVKVLNLLARSGLST